MVNKVVLYRPTMLYVHRV